MASLLLSPGRNSRFWLLAGVACLFAWSGLAPAAERTVLGELYSAEM